MRRETMIDWTLGTLALILATVLMLVPQWANATEREPRPKPHPAMSHSSTSTSAAPATVANCRLR